MDNMKPLNPIQKTVVGVQFLFVAFGATVLVPLLVRCPAWWLWGPSMG